MIVTIALLAIGTVWALFCFAMALRMIDYTTISIAIFVAGIGGCVAPIAVHMESAYLQKCLDAGGDYVENLYRSRQCWNRATNRRVWLD